MMKIGMLLVLLVLVPYTQVSGESSSGSLEVIMRSTTGEMADYHGVVLKIHSDDKEPLVIPATSNPFDVSLPINHKYKIEVFASSMYCDVDFVEMTGKNQQVELSIPIPGSTRLNVLYSDGGIPIDGALVSLRSDDNTYKYWTNSTTDPDGNTMRFWLQPTITNEEYYAADIYLDDDISYTFSPITIQPGLSQDIKIIAPWPKSIDQLITVKVYDSDSQKVSGLKNNLAVEISDDDGQVVATSKISHNGEANFSGLKVGKYLFRVINPEHKDQDLGSKTITLTGKTPTIQIFTAPIIPVNKTATIPISNHTIPESIPTLPTNSTGTDDLNGKQITSEIPAWIRNVADWWSKGQVSDAEFLKAVEYLVNNNIISIEHLQAG